MNLADIRHQYTRAVLNEESLLGDPTAQLERWLEEAARAEVQEPTAMTLATADAQGRPAARVVLLKGLNGGGLEFFTDYRSVKAQHLEANPQAAVGFFWPELERQVRVTGRVTRLSREASEAYFRTRPLGSQLGAWASHQDAVIADRAALEAQLEVVRNRYVGSEVPLPPHWGGYRIVPEEFEFWQGRENRLHDRFRYRREPGGGWLRARLSP